MRLASFRIQNYKVIDDTGWVPVSERVTALVGKNESGKTAILRAMWKSKNVAGQTFDKLVDYPLERYAKERAGTQEVVSLEFALSEEESKALSAQFTLSPKPTPKSVVYTVLYKGKDAAEPRVTFEDEIERICSRTGSEARVAIQALADALTPSIPADDATVSTAVATALKQIRDDAPLWDASATGALQTFDSAVSSWVGANESRATLAAGERQKLADLLLQAKQGNPAAKARPWVVENMPSFIYFDDYGQLETRIHLPTYLRKAATPDLRTRTQTALFEWGHLSPQEILTLGAPRAEGDTDEKVQRRKEERRILLESASFSLTGNWIDWWPEKRHRLNFDADGDDLVLLVSDEHNQFNIRFEERSHGFQWFFSFYLVFLVESQKGTQRGHTLAR